MDLIIGLALIDEAQEQTRLYKNCMSMYGK